MSAEINKPGTQGFKHVMAALSYSLSGLRAAVTHEEAFRLELLVIEIMLPLAFFIGRNHIEYAMLIGSLILVLIVELLNSAIEAIVDRVGIEHHELSGRAKDIGSAAVMLTIVNVAVIWGFIIYARM